MGMVRSLLAFRYCCRMNETEAGAGTGENGEAGAGARQRAIESKIMEIGFAFGIGVLAYFNTASSYMYMVVNSIWVPILVAFAAFVALALRYSTPVWSFASVVIVCVMTVFIGAPWALSMLLIALVLIAGMNSVAKRSSRKTVLICMFTGMGLALAVVLWWGMVEEYALLFLTVVVIGLWMCYENGKKPSQDGRPGTARN